LEALPEPETASEACWVADFSPDGWRVLPTESAAPLALSEPCSRVDFWESGFRLEAALSAVQECQRGSWWGEGSKSFIVAYWCFGARSQTCLRLMWLFGLVLVRCW